VQPRPNADATVRIEALTPGPTACARTQVNLAPFIMVSGRTPPDCDGTVDVFGYYFQPGVTVRVDLLFGFLVMDTFYAMVN
jgi:hypothetical protein